MNMSQRQRQSPVSSTSSTFRSSIPRTSDLPMDFEASYSSQVSQAEMQHFALSSSSLPQMPMYQPYLSGDYDYFSDMDGSLTIPVSGSMVNISPPESILDCSDAMAIRGRHGNPSPTYSSSELSSAPSYATTADCPQFLGPSYLDCQPVGLPSPPAEHFQDAYFAGDEIFMPQDEPTVCEYMGPSPVQAYRFDATTLCPLSYTNTTSKSRRSHPRSLRPSNERPQSTDSADDASSPSNKDDPLEKTKPRSDPLYDMKPGKDGFYHCPKQSETDCKHKPTKQRCIFA